MREIWKDDKTTLGMGVGNLFFDASLPLTPVLRVVLFRQVQKTGHRSQVTGHRSRVTGHRSQVTGHRSQKIPLSEDYTLLGVPYQLLIPIICIKLFHFRLHDIAMLNAGARNISGFRVRVQQLHGTSTLKTFVDIFEI